MTLKKSFSSKVIPSILLLLSFVIFNSNLYAATAPSLGAAQSFSVLGGSAITNTGPSIVNGDLGLSPGSSINGFPPGIVTGGSIHAADAIAIQAQTDATAAYIDLENQPCTSDLTGQNLGGLNLKKGIYCFSSSAHLTGTLTLDAEGDPNAVFIFKTKSTLITSSNARISVINGGTACNIFWQIGTSAVLGKDTNFSGNILALRTINLNDGTKVQGRVFALNAAVRMNNNLITKVNCSTNTKYYEYSCVFAVGGTNALSCTVHGTLCIENSLSELACPPLADTVNVSCDNGFSLTDATAQILYFDNLLIIQGQQLNLTAMIEIYNFNNISGSFQSDLILESKNSYRRLTGICKL